MGRPMVNSFHVACTDGRPRVRDGEGTVVVLCWKCKDGRRSPGVGSHVPSEHVLLHTQVRRQRHRAVSQVYHVCSCPHRATYASSDTCIERHMQSHRHHCTPEERCVHHPPVTCVVGAVALPSLHHSVTASTSYSRLRLNGRPVDTAHRSDAPRRPVQMTQSPGKARGCSQAGTQLRALAGMVFRAQDHDLFYFWLSQGN